MSKNVKEITVKIEGKEWKDALDKAFEKANKNAKIDGFRPGKAPKEMFLKKYGVESLYMDAGDLVLESAYKKVIEDNKDIELVAQPEIGLRSVDEDHIEFVFTLTTKPEVKLGKYKALKVKKEKVEVTKKEIDETIEQMRKRYAENVEKEDGKVENGDIAVIDFEGFKDGVAFEGGKGENYNLTIGSGTFIPGFEEQLVGMAKGEEKDINVTFPEDYHSEELKGQPVVFKVKVNEIKQIVIPEIGEEFFEDLGMDIKTEEELRKNVEETIKARKDQEVENKYIDDLLEEVIKNTEIEVPETLVHDEAHRMVHQWEEQYLKMQGISLEQFLQLTNSTEEKLMDDMHEEAERRVVSRFVLEEIAKVEKIDITDEMVDKEVESIAERYNMPKEEFLKLAGGTDMIKYDLTMKAAMDVIKGE